MPPPPPAFMGLRNRIECFVRFKADRSLCVTLFTNETCAFPLTYFFGFTVDNGGSQKTEIIGNT